MMVALWVEWKVERMVVLLAVKRVVLMVELLVEWKVEMLAVLWDGL